MSSRAERQTIAPGITVRHSRGCGSRDGGRCSCRPSYQASAWSMRADRPLRKTLPTLAAAKAWRQETQVGLRRRTISEPSRITFAAEAEDWLVGAKQGAIRTRGGSPYKPSAVRGYEQSLRKRVIPAIGKRRLSAIERSMLQHLIETWLGEGLSASTVRNHLLPIQAIYRRACAREDVSFNPTVGLTLPRDISRRDRVAPPAEAQALLAALPEELQALWGTALYAGLRRGELMALRWSDIDFEARLIHVVRGWDPRVGPILPKSRAGTRRVPLIETLRRLLIAHKLRTGDGGEALVFGRDGRPFASGWVTERSRRSWREHGLTAIGLHECRHSFASLMIAAGVNLKALSAYMGHGSVTLTLDRYGHLLPGNEREAGDLLESLLENSRIAEVGAEVIVLWGGGR